MPRRQRLLVTLSLLALLGATPLTTGCILGSNLSINAVVPLGFGGAPGVYNPFGIVQALVNAILGLGGGGGGGSASVLSPTSPSGIDPGTLGVLSTQ